MMPILRKIDNYESPDGPKFSGSFRGRDPEITDLLKVVSYNIDKGKEVELGLKDLQEFGPLQNADVVFLQEMDERGVHVIAQNLAYDYVYYPASIMAGQNFGNAILARWRIVDPKKLILPNKSWLNGQIRIAVQANVIIDGRAILVYCVHTEIYAASFRHRREQAAAVIQDIPLQAERVIVGGDFNTVSNRSIKRLTGQFAEAGLIRASKGAGATVKKYATNPAAADHIFTRGFEVIDRGKVKDGRASDHYPVWITLHLDE
jgi:endonuclease/exonuclease/phosphatase family metal-dependent hydrolase